MILNDFEKLEKDPLKNIDFDLTMYIVPATRPITKKYFLNVVAGTTYIRDSGNLQKKLKVRLFYDI